MKTDDYNYDAMRILATIRERLPHVAGMDTPLDIKQAEELIRRYGKQAVQSQFEKMENYKKLSQYRSAFLTCVKWFEMDIKKGWFTPPQKAELEPESGKTIFVKNFLSTHPVGSDLTINSQKGIVEDNTFIRLENNRLLPIADLFNNKQMEVL